MTWENNIILHQLFSVSEKWCAGVKLPSKNLKVSKVTTPIASCYDTPYMFEFVSLEAYTLKIMISCNNPETELNKKIIIWNVLSGKIT